MEALEEAGIAAGAHITVFRTEEPTLSLEYRIKFNEARLISTHEQEDRDTMCKLLAREIVLAQPDLNEDFFYHATLSDIEEYIAKIEDTDIREKLQKIHTFLYWKLIEGFSKNLDEEELKKAEKEMLEDALSTLFKHRICCSSYTSMMEN